jgi:phosphonate transport system substrate-binding protein
VATRRIFLRQLGCLLACPALPALAAGADAAPLSLAVHPYASTLSLINTYRPLQQYLASVLQRKVEFYTAPSFDAFVETLFGGGYDIAISPPHFAVMASEKFYLPILHFRTQLEPLLIVRNDSPLHRAEDFRGRRIAMADRSAFIRLVTVKWLADYDLEVGRDYQIVERPNHGASITAAVAGEVDAGLGTLTALKQLPIDVQQQVRAIGTGRRFAHLFTLVHRRLGEAQAARIKQALLVFQDTPEGRQFMEATAFKGYQEIAAEELRSLVPYVELYRRLEAGG